MTALLRRSPPLVNILAPSPLCNPTTFFSLDLSGRNPYSGLGGIEFGAKSSTLASALNGLVRSRLYLAGRRFHAARTPNSWWILARIGTDSGEMVPDSGVNTDRRKASLRSLFAGRLGPWGGRRAWYIARRVSISVWV
jgi:hypothetical protein